MGMAAILHQLLHQDTGGDQGTLGQIGEFLSQGFGAIGSEWLLLEQDLPGPGLLLSRKELEQRGFAAAVGADDPHQLAPGEGEGDLLEDGLLRVAELESVHGERHRAALGLY